MMLICCIILRGKNHPHPKTKILLIFSGLNKNWMNSYSFDQILQAIGSFFIGDRENSQQTLRKSHWTQVARIKTTELFFKKISTFEFQKNSLQPLLNF